MAIKRRWGRIAVAGLLIGVGWHLLTTRLVALTPRPAGWALQPPLANAEPVTADAMMPGIYPVGSRKRDLLALGGFGPCTNYSVDIADESWGKRGALSLVAFPNEAVSYFKHQGIAVRVINRGWFTASFQAIDSALELVREARDEQGHWRPIESGPFVICGNSFHRVFLPSGQCWEFPARVYTGSFQTKLRFRLNPGGGRASIYSNEFDGRISPAQFEKPGPSQVATKPG